MDLNAACGAFLVHTGHGDQAARLADVDAPPDLLRFLEMESCGWEAAAKGLTSSQCHRRQLSALTDFPLLYIIVP